MTSGLVLGFVYAIIALGYTMVYGVLQLINFAHSEVFVTGAVVGFELFRLLDPLPLNAYLKLLMALALALLASGLLNVIIERLAYRPLRSAPRLVPLITAIGVSLILQDVLRIIEGFQGRFELTYKLPPAFGAPFCGPESSCAGLGKLLSGQPPSQRHHCGSGVPLESGAAQLSGEPHPPGASHARSVARPRSCRPDGH